MSILAKEFNWQGDNLKLYNLFKEYKNCFILDSALALNKNGRFSFIGFDPFYILQSKNENSFFKLRELLGQCKLKGNKDLPFLGGAVGYFAYDLAPIIEKKIKLSAKDDLWLPDFYFGFYDAIIAIDRLRHKLIVVSNGFPEKKEHLRSLRAKQRLNFIINILKKHPQEQNENPIRASGLISNFTKENYITAVKKAQGYIADGDIYQVNLSQRFSANIDNHSFTLFKRLRQAFPTNFSAYFDAGAFQIISGSPERFLRVNKKIVETIPMKGTRGRGKTSQEDSSLKNDLWKSKKDQAELLMIVDLLRNDLGRVCSYNSIKVVKKRALEEYKTVFQTTATIKGKLHKNKDIIDLIMASFPGGSITGCPKIRSIEIIDKLEPTQRSIYTGAFGYLSFCGNMDLNILIRTFLKKKDKIYFQTGGGIVADSIPEAEYEESLIKAKALMEAINER